MLSLLKKVINLAFIFINWTFTIKVYSWSFGMFMCGIVVVATCYDLLAYIFNIKKEG